MNIINNDIIDNNILKIDKGKIYFTYNYLISLIKEFCEINKINSIEDLNNFLIYKGRKEKPAKLPALFNDFIKNNKKYNYKLGNGISIIMFKNYFDGKFTKHYESLTKGIRSIEMFDSEGKKLSNTTYKKALKYKNKGLGDWIEEGKKFKFNFKINQKIEPLDTLFNKIYKKQNGLCAASKKPVSIENAQLHHKYIPQCILKINASWNVEILSPEEHIKKHKNKFALVNILINLHKFYVSLNKKIKFKFKFI